MKNNPTPSRAEQAHTPVPWECPGSDGGEFVICHTDSTGKRRTLAHVYSKQDAAFIVTAVNAYDSDQAKIAALVQALKRAKKHIITGNQSDKTDALAEANAALKLATS
jgi:alpha-L-arabinofuranosidase